MGADATGPKKPLSDTVRQLGALSTVGFSFVLAVVLGAGLGLLIDRWLGTSPWVLLRLLRVRTGRGRAERLPHGRQLPEIVERDPTLRGVERNAIVIGALMTLAACFLRPWPDLALGVIGGGVLVGFSYWSLKSGVSAMAAVLSASGTDGAPPAREYAARARETGAAVRFTRSSGVRYDCAFAPAPIGVAGGCVLGCGGGSLRGGAPVIKK